MRRLAEACAAMLALWAAHVDSAFDVFDDEPIGLVPTGLDLEMAD